MPLKRFFGMFVGLMIVFSFLMINSLAEDTIDSWVETNFDMYFETGTDLTVIVTMNVHKLTTDRTYSAEEIRSATDEELGALKYELYLMLKNQLNTMFPNAEITNFSMPVYSNENTQGTPGEVAWDPPAIFEEELNVYLSSLFFNLSEVINARDLVNGVLDANAITSYGFNFQAEPGWKNTYSFILPASIAYRSTNGLVNGNRIVWVVENQADGDLGKSARLSLQLVNPTIKPSSEDISLEFKLNNTNPKNPSLAFNILAKTIKLAGYNFLPAFITNLDYLPSDGVRLFVDNGFISWDDIYQNTIKTVEEKTVSKIESSSFNQTLDMLFSWDTETTSNCSIPYNITHMDDNPPIQAGFIDSYINLKICGISSTALFGLSNIGAKAEISSNDINFGDNLNDLGYSYTGFLILPKNITLAGENIYTWNSNKTLSGRIETSGAPKYSSEKIESLIKIEISSTDLNLFSLFTGKTELLLGLYAEEETGYKVMSLPSAFSLPRKISIEYINSDAFRLCIDEDIFSKNNITNFLANEKQIFDTRLESTLQNLEIDGNINRERFEQSLIWDGNVNKMDDDTSINVVSSAHSSYPASFEIYPFDISSQFFNFTGLENQIVTYRVVLPKGTTAEFSDSLSKATLGETNDGRYYIDVAFDVNESGLSNTLTCKIVPSTLYIIGIFLPCILSVIIFIILIAVVIIVRRKRKFGGGKKRSKARKEEEDFESYEEQDYYVPPPPPSSK